MQIKKINLSSKIILLLFENQFEVSSSFLRFQEYYESPKFKGKFFSLNEFKEWYSKGENFTYYSDWGGFNVPSSIL